MRVKEIREKGKGISFKLFFLAYVLCLMPYASFSQCAMCSASLESEGNKTKVEAVNDGIVFLMAIPYIIVAGIGFVVYKMYYKKK
jgi:heme/copper-type cytochrome/quinol oxidase subunit 2